MKTQTKRSMAMVSAVTNHLISNQNAGQFNENEEDEGDVNNMSRYE